MFYFLKNGANFLKRRQEDVLSAAFVIAFSVALSRILGLVRYRLLASYFGDNITLLDSFIAASILPEAIFEVLIFGTIALAFISAVVIICAKFIAPIIAPGLISKDPMTLPLIARLLQIMILAQLFFVISIFLTGILQSFQRFLVPALASVFYNIGIILSIIFLAPLFGIYAAAIGMIFGALLHLIIQLPLISSLGFKYRPQLDFKNKDVREILKLMWPRSAAIGLTRLM